jgi:protein-S-isoprenylcysteine O-methyltransferase Ste14
VAFLGQLPDGRQSPASPTLVQVEADKAHKTGRAGRGVGEACSLLDSWTMRIPIPAIVVPLIVLLLYLFVPGLKERPWTALRVAGAILAVVGYVLFVTARLQLGKSFSVTPQAKELVTLGLYSRIRNPIYIGVDVMWLGLTVALRLYWLFVPFLGLLVLHVFRGRREAKVLQDRFGQTYLDYRKQTWF